MSDPAKCSQCGSELPPDFEAVGCPVCLMRQGLSPSTYLSGSSEPQKSARSGNRRNWTPPAPAELASRFPQLEIVELLGQGGMGAVYKVRQRELDRWAALKILCDEVAHDPSFSERFQREARALALLGHQHIVIVYEFGQRDGFYFLLMEFVDGVTLRQAIQEGQITASSALSIVTQICDALQFAHEEGVVHRDIKPENILIDRRGRVKIADFGLAKLIGGAADAHMLTGTHQVMGTPLYMAPEQMKGTRGVDHRADIFSLGVVFYELLTGELPIGRFAPPSQKYRLDVRLDEVVLRSLEKEPDRRYQQASQIKSDVESIGSSALPAAATAIPARSRKLALAWILSLVTLALLIVGGLTMQNTIQSLRSELQSAQSAFQAERTMRAYQAARETQKSDELVAHSNQTAAAEAEPSNSQEGRDPYEVHAIVRFQNGQPSLNPDFGTGELSSEQRQQINEILEQIHRRYLELESHHTTWIKGEANAVIAEIEPFPVEVSSLENDLWTEIDARLPVSQQRFLRDNLPLYAGPSVSLRKVEGTHASMMPMMNGNSSGAMGMPGMAASRAMTGSMAMMGSTSMDEGMGMLGPMAMPGSFNNFPFPVSLRYPQLLGWKTDNQPLRITIRRRGRWYRWMIEMASGSKRSAKTGEVSYFFQTLDQFEAPQLPVGLERFWKELPNVDELPGSGPAETGNSDNSEQEPPVDGELPFAPGAPATPVLDNERETPGDANSPGITSDAQQ